VLTLNPDLLNFAGHVKLHALHGERANELENPKLAAIINKHVNIVFRD
jgi:hypothetical protein